MRRTHRSAREPPPSFRSSLLPLAVVEGVVVGNNAPPWTRWRFPAAASSRRSRRMVSCESARIGAQFRDDDFSLAVESRQDQLAALSSQHEIARTCTARPDSPARVTGPDEKRTAPPRRTARAARKPRSDLRVRVSEIGSRSSQDVERKAPNPEVRANPRGQVPATDRLSGRPDCLAIPGPYLNGSVRTYARVVA